jgi:glycosyltransferase involved in cell wall biosynthesis
MLSYEKGIMKLYGFSLARLRLIFILFLQNWTLKRSNGVIFLTKYASDVIQRHIGKLSNFEIIHHGVSDSFKTIELKKRLEITKDSPINCLYVSNTAYYKNQSNVVIASEMLREKGYNIQLILVGGGVGKPQRHLEQQMRTSDPKGEFVKQYNFIKQTDLPPFLANADIYIFASSCENMPNTLLEGMAAGLPIACSDRGPMPEVLKDGGVYFDPLDPVSISNAIEKIIVNEEFRKEIAQIAKRSSENYSWTITADQTMTFIKRTLKRVKNE